MKTTRKLIPAIAMLLVSAVMLTTASYAWFTMGTQATADGMSVTAAAASALLIVDADKVTAGQEYAAFKDANNLVDLSIGREAKQLVPATAFDSAKHTNVETANNLVTLTGFDDVNSVTGKAPTDAAYKAATENTNFVEYIVYIASGAAELSEEGKALCANITYGGDTFKYIDNALSIQFTVDDDKTATVNFNQVQSATNQTYVLSLDAATVPSAFSGENFDQPGEFVKVVMRVYYDGALEDNAHAEKATYIRNDKMVNLTETAFNVVFDYKTVANIPAVE